MNRAQAMLDTLDEGMRELGSNKLPSDEAAALAFGLLARATSMILGKRGTPENVHNTAASMVDVLCELHDSLEKEAAQ